MMSNTEDTKEKGMQPQDSENCSPMAGYKTSLSSSVVLRQTQPLVPTFSRLVQNANLNLPPPNWLRSTGLATTFHYHDRNPFRPSRAYHSATKNDDDDVCPFEPSSMMLASHHPEDVGHVDVVADAKHIKKLLKLPYCTSLISMAIHRVANKTLLIDEFNAPLLLPRATKANLEKIFQESPAPVLLPRKKDPNSIHHRNMMSKFLYYSAQDDSIKALVPTTRTVSSSHFTGRSTLSRAASNEESFDDNQLSVVPEDSYSSPDMRLLDTEDHHDRIVNQKEIIHRQAIEQRGAAGTEDDSQVSNYVEQSTLSNESVEQPSLAFVNQDEIGCEGYLPVQAPIIVEKSKFDILAQPPFIALPASGMKDHLKASNTDSNVQNTDTTDVRVDSFQDNKVSPDVSNQNATVSSSDTRRFPLPLQIPERPMTSPGLVSVPNDLTTDLFPESPPNKPPQPFHLNVRWSVKNISMLLGSDLPIFGVDGHPAISVKLREMQKPITVLTGMDYWLDNLMCNVPELAMCFHVDGIVQGYDIIKTEDIPKLDESCQFPPEEVLDVVHNILGFLKANCTREGHTYWLFRKKGEDVVKLYDLTSLNCFQETEQAGQNPFAHSVAMLFYRVAHNMLYVQEDDCLNSEDLAIAKLLLENCIKLMGDKDKKITVSAYCLLSDLFLTKVPVWQYTNQDTLEGVNLESTVFDRNSDINVPENKCPEGISHSEQESFQSASDPKSKATSTNVTTTGHSKSFTVSLLRESRYDFPTNAEHPLPPLTVGSSLDRARLALEQISIALSCLNISAEIGNDTCSGTSTNLDMQSWQLHGASKLMVQAGMAYHLLAEAALKLNKLGRALRYGKYSIVCSSASSCLLSQIEPDSSNQKQSSSSNSVFDAWQLCGDIHCLSTKLTESFSANLEDFQFENSEDAPVIKVAQFINDTGSCIGDKEETCLSLHTELESSLLRSIDCYEFAKAVNHSSDHKSLEDRIGNAWNELGVYYMQVASTLDFWKEPKNVEKLWKKSYSCITDGLARFQSTRNLINQSLLYANLGKLMYSCAQAHGVRLTHKETLSKDDSTDGCTSKSGTSAVTREFVKNEERLLEYSHQEKLYYSKSIEYYLNAKQILRRRSAHPNIWTNFVADLSKVYLSMGVLMFEHPPLSSLSHQEVSQEITDVLMKALHQVEAELAQIDPQHLRYFELCKLAGDCHSSLGNLYHKNLTSVSMTSQKLKQLRILTEKHYSKPHTFYKAEHHPMEILKLLVKKASFFEQHAQGKSQLKRLQSSLACLLETGIHLKTVIVMESSTSLHTFCGTLLHQLQGVLKQILAVTMKKSETVHLVFLYKAMYEQTLRQLHSSVPRGDIVQSLLELLFKLHDINGDILKPTARKS